jgi:acetyl esterase/lipase
MRWRRRIGLALLVLVAIGVAMVAWEPTRVGLQTAALLPNLLDAGPKPLNLFSAAPQRVPLPYREGVDGSEPELAELWLPAWASAERRAGGMLLVLGVNNVGRNHPVVARVADGLARTGVAVLVPDSRVLLEGRLEVDPERVGVVGFSVGGSLALLAAADPRIADDVAWVNAFGAFADASTYLAAVSAHAYRDRDGRPVPWMPSELAREVYLRFMLDQVDDRGDRHALEDAYGDAILAAERPVADRELRAGLDTDGARAVHDLLTAPSLDEAEATIADLDAGPRAFIDAISPVRHLGGLAATVHLMHETQDHHVPYVESRVLADALRAAGVTVAAHTEFRLFDHVQPDDIDLLAATPELVKLLLHVRTLLEATL